MPLRQALILLAFFAACVALVVIAWASGADLYMFFPSRLKANRPPTSAGVVLAILIFCAILAGWIGQKGLYVFMFATASLVLGSAVGFLVYAWTPTLVQHGLSAAMIATSIYAWAQRDYFEE
jgi:hypothetical protein